MFKEADHYQAAVTIRASLEEQLQKLQATTDKGHTHYRGGDKDVHGEEGALNARIDEVLTVLQDEVFPLFAQTLWSVGFHEVKLANPQTPDLLSTYHDLIQLCSNLRSLAHNEVLRTSPDTQERLPVENLDQNNDFIRQEMATLAHVLAKFELPSTR